MYFRILQETSEYFDILQDILPTLRYFTYYRIFTDN